MVNARIFSPTINRHHVCGVFTRYLLIMSRFMLFTLMDHSPLAFLE